jgi:iron complex outermembrane receptor protein
VVLHARGLLAGSVYYMDMKDFIAPQTRTATYKDQTASATAGSDVYASYLMSSPDNIDASVKGLELTYEQPLGDSFGRCQLHLCGRQHRNRQAAARHLEEHLQPVSYFEHDKLGARVSYTWRSAFLRAASFLPVLSGSVRHAVGHGQLPLQRPLEPLARRAQPQQPCLQVLHKIGSNALPYAFYENGRQYYLNLHVSFDVDGGQPRAVSRPRPVRPLLSEAQTPS